MRHSLKQIITKSGIISLAMTVLLLVSVFFLPELGTRGKKETTGGRIAAESAEAGGKQTECEEAAPAEQDTRQTIVIDAGHGGDDPGMTGNSGITERVLNLVYAGRLEKLLTDAGYRVVMTRTTEDGLYDPDSSHKKAQDMQRRVAVIAEEKPVITVSIHQNSYQDPAVCGPQVFYYEHSAEGEQLAECIQNSLNTELAIKRPRVHKGNGSYYILKRSRSTTVIVECGFLSNPEEERKLQEPEYQDQVVRAVFDGVQLFLKRKTSKNM